jgi:hypothetical protein
MDLEGSDLGSFNPEDELKLDRAARKIAGESIREYDQSIFLNHHQWLHRVVVFRRRTRLPGLDRGRPSHGAAFIFNNGIYCEAHDNGIRVSIVFGGNVCCYRRRECDGHGGLPYCLYDAPIMHAPRVSRRLIIDGVLRNYGRDQCRAHRTTFRASDRCANQGAEIAKVQEWLGHANVRATRVYDHGKTRNRWRRP